MKHVTHGCAILSINDAIKHKCSVLEYNVVRVVGLPRIGSKLENLFCNKHSFARECGEAAPPAGHR